MVSITDVSTPERERLSWLTCLIGEYRKLYEETGGERADEDPEATAEMLREVEALADELEAKLPPVEEPELPVHSMRGAQRIGMYPTGMAKYRHPCGAEDTDARQLDATTTPRDVTCHECRVALGLEEPLPF